MRKVAILLTALALPIAAQVIHETPVSDVAYFHNQERVQAAGSDGGNVLVTGVRGNAAYAHRVTANGALLDGTGIRIALPPDLYAPTILGIFWDGNAYTVIMSAPGWPTGTTWVARIDGEGHLI